MAADVPKISMATARTKRLLRIVSASREPLFRNRAIVRSAPVKAKLTSLAANKVLCIFKKMAFSALSLGKRVLMRLRT